MADRAARQRRRPPAAAPPAPAGAETSNSRGKRAPRQRGHKGRHTTASQPKPTMAATALRMPTLPPSSEMASLTTALLDKNENQPHFLELQSSSHNDEERNSGTNYHNIHLSSSSSSAATAAELLNSWSRRMRHNFISKLGTTTLLPILLSASSSCKGDSTTQQRQNQKCHNQRQHFLAFFSHFCFILASSLYVQLSFVNREWMFVARDQYHVPMDVLAADDDIAWHNWETSSSLSSLSSIANLHVDKNNINNNNNTTTTTNNKKYIHNLVSINNNHTTSSITDDDVGYDPILESIRNKYTLQSTSLQIYASLFFVLVGIFDWMRYRDTMNIFMICAGGAGMASGMATTSSMESVWNCVSVHIYLLEAYNLSHRQERRKTDNHSPHHHHKHANNDCDHHDDDGRNDGVSGGSNSAIVNDHHRQDDPPGEGDKYLFIKVGNTCFLVGCILDVLGSYVDLVGAQGLWVIYADMTSNFLWLECALIELGAEIYFLYQHHHHAATVRKVRNGIVSEEYTLVS